MKYIMILLLILLAGCAGHKEGDCYIYLDSVAKITKVGEYGVNVDFRRTYDVDIEKGYLPFNRLDLYYAKIDCFGVF